MSKYIFFMMLVITTSLFAQEEQETFTLNRESFTYIQLGGGAAFLGKDTKTFPSIGLGRRYCTPQSAIDVSLHLSPGENGALVYSTPRVLYLRYLTPQSSTSFYAGAGLSWTGLYGPKHKKNSEGVRKTRQRFSGIAGEFTLGREFCRTEIIRPFAQLSVTQPVISSSRKGSFPSPIIVLSLGAGF